MLERDRRKIVGPDARKRTAEAADGGADVIANKNLGHQAFSPWAFLVRAWSSRRVWSSSLVAGGVSANAAENRKGQPHCAATASRVTPGCRDSTVSSFVCG